MPEFQLVSDFQPTGDQPQAIDRLAAGLRRGLPHQALLGVTGSGKSVVADTPVLVRQGEEVRCEPIGPLIDRTLAEAIDRVQVVGDTKLLESEAGSLPLEVFSFDPTTGQPGWKPVRQFVRHTSPERLSRVISACGRAVTITGDHNLFALREGRLQLLRTDELQPTDYLPLPLRLPEPDDPLTVLELDEHVESEDRVYVALDHFPAAWVGHTALLQPLLTPAKAHNVIHQGERVSLDTYRQLVRVVPSLAQGATFGAKRRTYASAASQPLTPELLRLIGYYIGEGHAEDGYLTLSSAEEPVISDIQAGVEGLGLQWRHRPGTYDYQVSSRLWARLLTRWCGRDSRAKQLPPFWTQLSNINLAQLLRAYFSADGGVEHDEVTCISASQKLVSDLSYALLRFGIVARLRERQMKVPGRDERRPYWRLTISGVANLRAFAESIGFVLPRKTQRLAELLTKDGNTNVDLIPLHGPTIRRLRTRLGLWQGTLAERAGCVRSMVSLIESGHRRPSRTLATALLCALRAEAEAQRNDEALREIESLTGLLSLFWTPVQSVQDVPGERYVYDFAVQDNETFLAGSGGLFVHNTFTMANVIQQIQRPTLVMAHNKTLAAQLASEFKEFFPNNAVEYFVSYYDYYQPEAYIPRTDTYIEKDTLVNEDIERLRHSTMQSLLTRRDVLVVASVSCIYGLGDPEDYGQNVLRLRVGEAYKRDKVLRFLTDIYYERNDYDVTAGRFRVRGDTLEIHPASQEIVVRVSFWGDEIERISEVDPLTGEVLADRTSVEIYPARYFVTTREKLEAAIKDIQLELDEQLQKFEQEEKLLEAQRLRQRTQYDIEMLQETGFCSGVENYSRHLSRRAPGSTPWTLLDYFPDDFVTFIDESHMTIPQVRGMYNGDRARKEILVDFGFRLPSALDNRPLIFHEFEQRLGQVLFVSATPGPYELTVSRVPGTESDPALLGNTFEIADWEARREGAGDRKALHESVDGLAALQLAASEEGQPTGPRVRIYGAEQLIRPTGLLDPEIEVKPTRGQIDDLMEQIQDRTRRGERVLVTTLTKRMAEDLADFLRGAAVKVHYLHSEIDTLERIEILRDLRLGVYDVVVGINLLREGLDLPEVSLVAILDADKEGYLRSESALIQNIGRAARHVNGHVIMYADTLTYSMQRAIEETYRRRGRQHAYNQAHGITPVGIRRAIRDLTDRVRAVAEAQGEYNVGTPSPAQLPRDEVQRLIRDLESQMKQAAKNLEFEKAAALRDQVVDLKRLLAADDGDQTVPREFASTSSSRGRSRR